MADFNHELLCVLSGFGGQGLLFAGKIKNMAMLLVIGILLIFVAPGSFVDILKSAVEWAKSSGIL